MRIETAKIERLFLSVGMFILIGGLSLQLSGTDTSVAVVRESATYRIGSLTMQLLLGSAYLGAGLIILRTGRTYTVLRSAWPILLLPTLALLSMAWSPDPSATLRKAIAFLGTVLFGLAIAAQLSERGTIRLIAQVLSTVVILSVLWVFLFPTIAVHQITDAWPYQGIHAGSWRGVVGHRTLFGHLSGLTFAILWFYGPIAIRSLPARCVILILSLVSLVMANSGGGFLTAAGLTALLYAFAALPRAGRVGRTGIAFTVLLGALGLAFLGDEIIRALLELLGKQPDLTGRVPFWGSLIEVIQERPLLGFGYYSGFAYEVGLRIARTTGDNFINPHNGYLSILTSMGYVGFAAGVFMLGWVIAKSFRWLLRSPAGEARLGAFPLAIVGWVIGVNVVEDALTTGNDIVVLLLAIVAGMVAIPRRVARARPAEPGRTSSQAFVPPASAWISDNAREARFGDSG